MRQEKRMHNPGKNNHFVNSRQGGPMEHSRTKQESIKHNNPEFFKRQQDRASNENVGRGIGCDRMKEKDGGPGSGPKPGDMHSSGLTNAEFAELRAFKSLTPEQHREHGRQTVQAMYNKNKSSTSSSQPNVFDVETQKQRSNRENNLAMSLQKYPKKDNYQPKQFAKGTQY